MDNFPIDSEKEKLNAPIIKGILNKHFKSVVEVNDRDLQLQGIDFICDTVHKLDAKEPTDWFSKSDKLSTWAYEFGNARHNTFIKNPGWGVNKLSTTTYLWAKPMEITTSPICNIVEYTFIHKIIYSYSILEYCIDKIQESTFPERMKLLNSKVDSCDECIMDIARLPFCYASQWLTDNFKNGMEAYQLGLFKLQCNTVKDERPVFLTIPWKLIQLMADRYRWKRGIYNYTTNTITDYTDDIAAQHLGSTYISNINKIINDEKQLKEIDKFFNIADRIANGIINTRGYKIWQSSLL